MDCDTYNTSVKRKRRSGKLTDVMKKIRTASHEIGDDCKCIRFKCFQTVLPDERVRIISTFNQMTDYDTQNKYLSGLITLLPVQQRRSRVEPKMNSRDSSYCYRVRVNIDERIKDVRVCHRGFLSMHGITNRRVQTIKKQLIEFGDVRKDNRGKHSNRPSKLSDNTKLKMTNFIKSLKGRKSHYSLKDTSKIYLPEELNKSKLHRMYNDSNVENQVGYSTFCQFFDSNFNISFGFPRKDTCSTCDLLKAEMAVAEKIILECADEETKVSASKSLHTKENEHAIHLALSAKFYDLKKDYKKKSKQQSDMACITMDFQKNLPTPNITTSDVYYRRQLNFISFNIHILKDSTSIFYTYDESVARKGADEVCSMLDHFFSTVLSSEIRHLIIFCDSCAGQNKNYTVIRFLHYIIHNKNRFDSVEVIFPIRGHSYMESDKDMSLVNGKAYTETSDDWREVLEHSRIKPFPFKVINCTTDVNFHTWTLFLSKQYAPKCPIPTRPMRRILFTKNEAFILYKTSFSGYYEKFEITPKRKPKVILPLKKLYDKPLPVKNAKLKDLLHLAQFLTKETSQNFYKTLKSDEDGENDIEYCDDVLIDEEQ
jgi:hypothetical protein